jgi:hypothetical protein
MASWKTVMRRMKVGSEKAISADLKESDDAPNANRYGLFHNGPSVSSANTKMPSLHFMALLNKCGRH